MRVSRRSKVWATVTAVAVTFVALRGGAAPTNSDKATAQMLFDDALKLLGQKKYDEACRKLEESQRLDPGMGTQYRLGECYEKLGRVASAWVQYREVVDAATAAGLPDRERKARARASAIEPRIPHLIVAVPTSTTGLHVTRDGAEVGEGQYGSAVPVDPGTHRVEAKAAGHEPWSSEVEVAEKATITVTVPALRPSSAAGTGAGTAVDTGSKTRMLALVVAGVGTASLVGSGLLMLSARSIHAGSDPHCVGEVCDQEGVDIRDRARARGNIGTALFVVGAAALVCGGVLWLTSPGPGTKAAPRLGVTPGGAILTGRF